MSVKLGEVQQAGFPMGAEPLVALDLVDTLMTVTTPPTDLLAEPANAARWWELQAPRLPDGPIPDPAATRQLRAALRDLLDGHLEGRDSEPVSLDDVNAAAAAVPTSPRMVRCSGGVRHETRWHIEHGGNAILAAIAREGIALLTDPSRLASLRRCASPSCSMLFLAENARRVWCTANICGNRARVARHYERTHQGSRAN